MITFNNDTEKIEFLRKYRLLSETSGDLSGFYYYKPESNSPTACEIIGYDCAFETWAAIAVTADNETYIVHSDYLSDMKKRGRTFHKAPASKTPRQPRKTSAAPYIVFDLETTGLNYKQDEIIEIAAVKYNGEEVTTFNKLVKPASIVPENITRLTGITNEMLQDAASIETVLPEFLQFIGSCKLVGHNIKTFDILFLNRACQNLGLPAVKNKTVDTLTLARKSLPGLANYKLATLCAHYGIDASGAHRALEDCYMCGECYCRLLAK
ncbi:MAG: 3'-5' exonuclease [Bacillus sp. (in: Bacteria)]|nr:3'-5' exonuclease [Bacillus sp. (in: firmicutes)]MCM1427628.1 3'-5' exonuclease [Eubacterium sp.]